MRTEKQIKQSEMMRIRGIEAQLFALLQSQTVTRDNKRKLAKMYDIVKKVK